jgi:hypothetical protein
MATPKEPSDLKDGTRLVREVLRAIPPELGDREDAGYASLEGVPRPLTWWRKQTMESGPRRNGSRRETGTDSFALRVPESCTLGRGQSGLNGSSLERYRTAVAGENIYLVCWFGGVAVAVVLGRRGP